MAKQTQLTKEYFDKVIGSFSNSVDKRFNSVDRRFKENTNELKAHVSKEIADLAGMTARGFHDTNGRIDIVAKAVSEVNTKLDLVNISTTHKIENHERRIKRVEDALAI